MVSEEEEDNRMMLGTKNYNFRMERYAFKRRTDGIYIINLGKTWDKLNLAARVIVGIENPQDIIVQSAGPYGQRAVLKFTQYTGSRRHTPGTFTNEAATSFSEPRLLILTDPRTDHQVSLSNTTCEGQFHAQQEQRVFNFVGVTIYAANQGRCTCNIPTIAFCDTDSPMRYADIGIPANKKGKHSTIGCLFWLLARMVLQMRGVIPLGHVDLFFYRDPEEAKEQEGEAATLATADCGAVADYTTVMPTGQWNTDWTTAPVPQVVPHVAGADWTSGQDGTY